MANCTPDALISAYMKENPTADSKEVSKVINNFDTISTSLNTIHNKRMNEQLKTAEILNNLVTPQTPLKTPKIEPLKVLPLPDNMTSNRAPIGSFTLYNIPGKYEKEYGYDDVVIEKFNSGGIKITPNDWDSGKGVTFNPKTNKNGANTWELIPGVAEIANPEIEIQEHVVSEGNGWKKETILEITSGAKVNAYTKEFTDDLLPGVPLKVQYDIDKDLFKIIEPDTGLMMPYASGRSRIVAYDNYKKGREKTPYTPELIMKKRDQLVSRSSRTNTSKPYKTKAGTTFVDIDNDTFDYIPKEYTDGMEKVEKPHVTIFGFPTKKKIDNALKEMSEKDRKKAENYIDKIVSEFKTDYEETDNIYKIKKEYPEVTNPKTKEVYPGSKRESIVQEVKMFGISELYADIKKNTGIDIGYPYPHVTIATKGHEHGIAILSKSDLRKLNPEEVKYVKTQGSNRDPENVFFDPNIDDTIINEEEINLGENDNFFEKMKKFINEDRTSTVPGEHIQKTYTPEFAKFQIEMADMMQEQFNNIDMSNIKLTEIQTSLDDQIGADGIDINERRETAGKITHDLMGGPADVKLRWNRFSANSRKSEVFMHEMVHFLTNKAFGDDQRTRDVLDQLRKKALATGIDYNIFLQDYINSGQQPSSIDIEIAKRQFQYVFDEYADPEEFFAYMATNEHVYNAVKDIKLDPVYFDKLKIDDDGSFKTFKNFINKFIGLINDVWGKMASSSGSGEQILVGTMKKMMEAQEEINRRERENRYYEDERLNNFAEKMSRADEKLSESIKNFEAGIENLGKKANKNNLGKKYAKKLEKVAGINRFMNGRMLSDIYTEITEKTDNPQWAHLYEMFRQGKEFTEKHSKAISDALKRELSKKFEGIDEPTRKAITRVVFKLDLPSLNYKSESVRELLNDDEVLSIAYNDSLKILRDRYTAKDRFSFFDKKREFESDLEQMLNLAKHMNDGKIYMKNQQFNAENILNKYHLVGTDQEVNTEDGNLNDEELISEMNKFITIAAIREAGSEDKQLVYKYLLKKENRENIAEMMNQYKFYVTEAADDMNITNFNSIKKGYFDSPNDKKMKFDIVAEKDLEYTTGFFGGMKNIGSYGTINGVKYFKVTGRDHELGYDEGMFSIAGNGVPGQSLKSLLIDNLQTKDKEENRKRKRSARSAIDETVVGMIDKIIENGGTADFLDIDDNQNLIPVYDPTGKIVDYNIDLNIADTVENLGIDLDVVTTAAYTFSKLKHRQAAIINNKKVVDTLIKYAEDYAIENPDDFVTIYKHETGPFNEEVHGRWNRIPEYTRNYIFQKTDSNSLTVPKNKLHIITGEKEASMSNFNLGPIDVRENKKAQKIILAVEGYIREVLGYLKETIAIRTGAVVAANTISNMFQAWIRYGIDPIDFVKRASHKWAELDAYRELDTKLNDLYVKHAGAGTKEKKKTIQNNINNIKNQMENNSFHALVEDGQFSPIIEDVNTAEKPTGHISQALEKAFTDKKVPTAVNKIKEQLFMDHNTSTYKTMLKITQYGDTITREVIREKVVQDAINRGKPLDEKGIQKLLNTLDQLFVNYGYTMNRYMRYFERVFGVFFTKYLFRDAKAIHSVATEAPASFGLFVGFEQLSGIDFKSADDDYWDFFGALFNRMNIDNPYEVGVNVATPNIGNMFFGLDDLYVSN